LHSLGFEEFTGEAARSAVVRSGSLQNGVDQGLVFRRARAAQGEGHAGQTQIEQPPAARLAPVVGPLGRGEGDQLKLAPVQAEAPVKPSLVWLEMPYHDKLTSDSIEAFAAVTEALGGQVERIKTSEKLAALVDVQHTIHEYEFCHHLSETLNTHWDQVSDTLKPIVQRGRKISQSEYEDALVVMDSAETFFEEFFHDYDAVIAPSATGEAPKFGDSTGDPIFCTIWNLAGLPCVTMPLLVGETGLPIGVQLIGAKEEDDRLLRTANWVLNELKAEA